MIAPQSYQEQRLCPARLVEEQMPLVQRLAWHFHGRVGRFVEVDGLLQAGYLGLVDASKRYSVCDGVSFAATNGALQDVLARGGISPTKTSQIDTLTPESLTDHASAMTVLVSCWE